MPGPRALLGGWRHAFRERRQSLADRLASTRVAATPVRWDRRPTIAAGDEVCLFLSYAADGTIPAHSLHHARAWAAAGFRTVLVVTADDLAQVAVPDAGFAAGIVICRNDGYDFGGWAAAIRALPELRAAKRLALVNDSIYGPLDTFEAFLARVRASDADFVGVIESREVRHHYQSFLLFFGARALRSRAFRRFWADVRNGSRTFVIDRYETRLLGRLTAAGLRAEALFAAGDGVGNATLTDAWRTLVADGFPFVKTRLLRDNPRDADLTGWRALLRARGYDVALIDAHLGGRAPA